MGVSFNCESCGKKIKAPDGTGGKWGNCPFCGYRCYIPLPETEGEELKLAPIDESEESHYRRMIKETQSLTKTILGEKPAPEDLNNISGSQVDQKQLRTEIINYLKQMAQGHLEDAQKSARKLKSMGAVVRDALDDFASSEISEPELANVSPGLIAAFIKKLRGQLS